MSERDSIPPSIPDLPMPDGSETVYQIGRAVLSLFPLPVAPVAEMFIRSPMDKRVDNWRIQLTRVVEHLRQPIG